MLGHSTAQYLMRTEEAGRPSVRRLTPAYTVIGISKSERASPRIKGPANTKDLWIKRNIPAAFFPRTHT
jgi:hypothetical protein